MREKTFTAMPEARMMDLTALTNYLCLGRNKAAEFGKECGAEKHIGRRVLYDKQLIDEALDKIEA